MLVGHVMDSQRIGCVCGSLALSNSVTYIIIRGEGVFWASRFMLLIVTFPNMDCKTTFFGLFINPCDVFTLYI